MLTPGVTVILNACVPVIELPSVTLTVKLLVPEVVGVPEITPVPLFKLSPLGSVPDATDHE